MNRWRFSGWPSSSWEIFLGVWGVMIGLVFVVMNLCGESEFGVPLLSPIAPFRGGLVLRDVLARENWKKLSRKDAKGAGYAGQPGDRRIVGERRTVKTMERKTNISSAQFFLMMFVSRVVVTIALNAQYLGGENMVDSIAAYLLSMVLGFSSPSPSGF